MSTQGNAVTMSEETFTCSTTRKILVSRKNLWAGRVISTLVILLMFFDIIAKMIQPAFVLKGATYFGYSVNLIAWIGAILLVCTLLYAIPRTAVLGAILLTGYLGGAIVTHLRVAGHLTFPIGLMFILGVLLWLGIFLREPRLHVLIPLRRESASCAT
jgi:hypothetical protein